MLYLACIICYIVKDGRNTSIYFGGGSRTHDRLSVTFVSVTDNLEFLLFVVCYC